MDSSLLNVILKELTSISTNIKMDPSKTKKFLHAIPQTTLKDCMEFFESHTDILKICCTCLSSLAESKAVTYNDVMKQVRTIFDSIRENASISRTIPIHTAIDYITLVNKIIISSLPQPLDVELLFPLLDEVGELIKINIPEHFSCTTNFGFLFCCCLRS